jgi:nucleoside-diphosphate-sugar epimerase
VTGGAGFIGSHLCDALVARGDTVRVLDDLSTGRRSNLSESTTLIEGDVADPALALPALATAVAQVRIDSCMTQSVISCQRALAGTRFAWFKKILAASVMRVYGALARVCWKQWASNRRPACMPWRKTATKRFVLVAFLITARSAMARC